MAATHWKHEPEDHDYPAAAAYLSLTTEPEIVALVVEALKVAPIETYQGKDILRAAGLPALPHDNVHVASDLAKVQAGRALSPVLLIRGDAENGVPLQIADGYHRVCAAYHLDENTDVPCRIVGLPGVRAAAR